MSGGSMGYLCYEIEEKCVGQMPDLKPCQAAARGTKCRETDWRTCFFVCLAYCAEINRSAKARVCQENFDGFVETITVQDVMRELCKCCKEIADENA